MSNKEKVLFLVVGEIGAGKDTLVRKIVGRESMVVSYTTREKREGETEGLEHFFISEDTCKELERECHIIAPCTLGKVKYFSTVESIMNGSVYIIEPSGVRWFKEHKTDGLRVVVIGINSSLETRRERCNLRGDDCSYFNGRVTDESKAFIDFRLNGDNKYRFKQSSFCIKLNNEYRVR